VPEPEVDVIGDTAETEPTETGDASADDAGTEGGEVLEESAAKMRLVADDDFSQYGAAVTGKGRKGAKEPKASKREKREAKNKLNILFDAVQSRAAPTDAWAEDLESTALRHPNDKWDKEHYRNVLAWVRSHVRQAPGAFLSLEELVTRCLAHPSLPAARELAPEKRLHKALRKVFRGLPKGVVAHSLFANLRVGTEDKAEPVPPVSKWGTASSTERFEATERPEGPVSTATAIATPTSTLNGTPSTAIGSTSARMSALSLAPSPPLHRSASTSPPPSAGLALLQPSPSLPLFGMGSGMWGGAGSGGWGAPENGHSGGLGGLGLGSGVNAMWGEKEEIPESPTPLSKSSLREASSSGSAYIHTRAQTQM
jgi:hypothetical protein